MSAGGFFRTRILQQTYNIPQLIPGGVVVVFQFTRFLVSGLVPVPVLTGQVDYLFSEIDAIPSPPDTLSMSIPVPTISVQATTP